MNTQDEKYGSGSMKHAKILFILFLISLSFFVSGCEEKMSAEEIAAKMQEKQASIEDYSGIINTTVYLNGEKSQEEVRIMFKKPNFMKSFITEQGKERVEAVSDGEFVWSYDAVTNTVTKMKLPKDPLFTEKDYIGLISNFMNNSKVSVLGTEEVDGISAYVLETEPKAEGNESLLAFRTKIWVDKETWMVLKCNMSDNEGNPVTEVEIRDLKLNTGIPDSEFKFEVPEGAEVKTVDLNEELKGLSLEEARQQASFEILTPDYIPHGYVLNFTKVYKDNYKVPTGQVSETVILSYMKGAESFDIAETVYQSKPEDDLLMQEAENISINGREGKYLNKLGDLKILRWELGEVEITLSGTLEKTEMLKIAESIQEHFTEFYILGPEGKAENYPTDFVPGESGIVIVGITNHEQEPVNYTMDVRLENKSLPLPSDQKNIHLGNNETWQKAITITPSIEGINLRLDFLLYNEDKKEVLDGNISLSYRNLNLLINVSQNVSENPSITAKSAI